MQPAEAAPPAASVQPQDAAPPTESVPLGDLVAGTQDHAAARRDDDPNLVIAKVTDLDWLPAGLETMVRHWYPDRAFVLHPQAAQGDLDGDGDIDAVLHIQTRSVDSPQAQLCSFPSSTPARHSMCGRQ